MPARITVRAELASLLAKSQSLTDANRLQQLAAEQRRRDERAQLDAKRKKEAAKATRRRQLEDPVGRSRLTAAMGQRKGAAIGWLTTSFLDVGGGISEFRVKVASGNGQAVALHSYDYFTPQPGGGVNVPVLTGGFIAQTFPAPNGILVIVAVVETVDIAAPDPIPGPDEFVGTSFSAIKNTAGFLVTQTSVTAVPVPGFNLENQQIQFRNANKTNAAGIPFVTNWFGDNFSPQQGSIIPTPAEIGGISMSSSLGLASPQFYLVNDAYDQSNYVSTAQFLARIQGFRDEQLGGFTFPDNVPVTIASSVAVPSEAPFIGGWDPVIGYDFGQTGFVAAKFAAMVSPPPPPP